jgi:hypothetical protein
MHEALGDFKAARLHVSVRAQLAYLYNRIAGLQAEAASGLKIQNDGNEREVTR